MNDKQRAVLAYMVAEDYHVEAGNLGLRGTAPFATLAAMERRGWVTLTWKRQSALYGSAKPYRVAVITDAGRAAYAEVAGGLGVAPHLQVR